MDEPITIQVPVVKPIPEGAKITPIPIQDFVKAALVQGVIQGAGHLTATYHTWPMLESMFHSVGHLNTIPFVEYEKLQHVRRPADEHQRIVRGEVIAAHFLTKYATEEVPAAYLKHIRQEIVTPGVRNPFFYDVYVNKASMAMDLPIRQVSYKKLDTLTIAAARLIIPHDLGALVTTKILPIVVIKCIQLLINHLALPKGTIKTADGKMRPRSADEIDLSPHITNQTASVAVSVVCDNVDAGLHTVYVCFLSKTNVQRVESNQLLYGDIASSALTTEFHKAKPSKPSDAVQQLIDSVRSDLRI